MKHLIAQFFNFFFWTHTEHPVKDTWKLIKKSEQFEKNSTFLKKGIKIESFKCGYSWKANKPAFLHTQILSSIWVWW